MLQEDVTDCLPNHSPVRRLDPTWGISIRSGFKGSRLRVRGASLIGTRSLWVVQREILALKPGLKETSYLQPSRDVQRAKQSFITLQINHNYKSS